jgi:Rrf2 family transcriptional regulator, iron-sulfur cluster assembly transcription factor
VLQALVRGGILKGVRGPRGGYALARERKRVTANNILRAAAAVDSYEKPHVGSELLSKVVLPALANAEEEQPRIEPHQCRRHGARRREELN